MFSEEGFNAESIHLLPVASHPPMMRRLCDITKYTEIQIMGVECFF